MKIELSNVSVEDFANKTVTLTLSGLTQEELEQITKKLNEMGWVKQP